VAAVAVPVLKAQARGTLGTGEIVTGPSGDYLEGWRPSWLTSEEWVLE
jgi:hypothetical protein